MRHRLWFVLACLCKKQICSAPFFDQPSEYKTVQICSVVSPVWNSPGGSVVQRVQKVLFSFSCRLLKRWLLTFLILFLAFHFVFFFFLLHWDSMKKETWQSISENKIKKTNEGLHADLHIRYRVNLIMISSGHYLKEEHYSKLILLHHLWSCPLHWATPGSSIFWAQTLKARDHLPWASAAEFSSSQIWTRELRNRPFEQWLGTITQGIKWGERILLPVVTLCILQPLQHIGDGRCGGRSRRHRRRIQAFSVLLVELEGCRYLVTDGIFDRQQRRSKWDKTDG